MIRSFTSYADFALIVHPREARSTVGTAWILRRSISNLKWFESNGLELDTDPDLIKLLNNRETVPLLLFPGPQAFNLNQITNETWNNLVSDTQRPLFIVIDSTWTQAHIILKRSVLLRSLPRVSFEATHQSEYGFKTQPNPACLSTLEGVHRVIEILAARNWGPLPSGREHDHMLDIFRAMVKFQLAQT
jgi:DTW domain-containing protein YfiP